MGQGCLAGLVRERAGSRGVCGHALLPVARQGGGGHGEVLIVPSRAKQGTRY